MLSFSEKAVDWKQPDAIELSPSSSGSPQPEALLTPVVTVPPRPTIPRRPPISLASPTAFLKSVYARLSLLLGQTLSLLLTFVSVLTTELVDRNWVLPSTQVLIFYTSICMVYTPYTIYRYGFRGWCKLIAHDGWKYFLLALGDFEAGYLYVKAFGYTDLMSCMLLDSWSIPVCMAVCFILMRVRYHWTQITGVLICISGLVLLVISDLLTDKNGTARQQGVGDAFMIASGTLYGIVNAVEEVFIRRSPLYEVLGQMGMWGMICSAIQSAAVEHKDIPNASWNGATVGLLLGYATYDAVSYRLVALHEHVTPHKRLLRTIIWLLLFHYSPYWLYFVAFVIVIMGLVTYFSHATPEEQGTTDVRLPKYLGTDENRGGMSGAIRGSEVIAV
ncbi:hypothetical protein HYDPIDRAFT_25244 [Hydnomerulius pinastri MD-312]|nr:hypothetical protein HYDPIDRAFT_25244 [Hydnomerulius pinastri MD-312]